MRAKTAQPVSTKKLLIRLWKSKRLPVDEKIIISLLTLNKISGFCGMDYQYDKRPELGNQTLYDFGMRYSKQGVTQRAFGHIVADFWNRLLKTSRFEYTDFAWYAPTFEDIIRVAEE